MSPPPSPYTPSPTPSTTPYKQIRAHYTPTTITVYQAYNTSIATAAVAAQRLDASPRFRTNSRMTWIKPSWAWMLYRAGYSYKDSNQSRILALKMSHADFIELLSGAELTTHGGEVRDGSEGGKKQDESGKGKSKGAAVKVQWDPERTVRLGKLEHRSIQIGIPGAMTQRWVEEMIVGIEDVTERARELKRELDEEGDVKKTVEELVEMGLVPEEREFEVPEAVRRRLGMVGEGERG